MSRKNHILVNGRLLQTNKRFSDLKEKQKSKIAEWVYEAYRDYYIEHGKIPNSQNDDEILEYVFDEIEKAEIWIPDYEIYNYYAKKKSKLQKRLEKELNIENI